jgi:integrase
MGRCSAISKDQQAKVERELLRSANPYRDRCLFVLGIETGLRISELLSVRIGDVMDTSGRVREKLIIQKAHVKGKHKSRRISLSPYARDAIYDATKEAFSKLSSKTERHLFSPTFRAGSISRRQAYCIISRALRAAGVTHTFGTHTMRKTRAERVAHCALRKHFDKATTTLPTVAVMRALGHSNLQTTERYLSRGTEEVDQWTAAGEI